MKKTGVTGFFGFLLLIMLTLSTHANIQTLPALAQFKLVGAGQLSWWGMLVYEARLFTPDGAYRPGEPHAIEITYSFRFSKEQLADRSLEEIERLFGKLANSKAVIAQLRSVLRDVSEGDRIVSVHYPGQGADFYSENRLLGRIEDADLAKAFFAIWLNPKTSEPELRTRLLGYNQ